MNVKMLALVGVAGLGAGALSSTLHDMLRFLELQFSPPHHNIGQAIQLTHQAPDPSLNMGLGWGLSSSPGVLCKDGLVSGYCSFMTVDTVSRIAIVVAANTKPADQGAALASATMGTLTDLRGSTAALPTYPLPPNSLEPNCPAP